MAEKRKLMAEMEKCFKKVDEGVELFEETMTKMQEANSENQREKFQDDLKKEIKKLQRLRDQIKGWQNSSDIKDKEKLTHYRKVIEQRMEQFKDIERENKTKPHSKQGLSAEEKLDPREKEKADTIEWLQSCIRNLGTESDMAESKIESLGNSEPGKKRGKKDEPKNRGDKEQRLKKIEELGHHLERMKFHISNLEVCMRLVNNETLDSKHVSEHLREPLEMYIEALDPEHEDDPETLDPEGIYDDLDLGSYTQQLGGVTAIGTLDDADNSTPGSSPPISPIARETNKELEELLVPVVIAGKQRHSSGDTTTSTVGTSLMTSHSRPTASGFRSTPSTPLKMTSQTSADSSISSPPRIVTPPPPPLGIPYNSVAASGIIGRATSIVKTSTCSSTSSKQTTPAPVDVRSFTPGPSTVTNVEQTTTPLRGDTSTVLIRQCQIASPISVLSSSVPSGDFSPHSMGRFYTNGPTSQHEVMTLKSIAEQAAIVVVDEDISSLSGTNLHPASTMSSMQLDDAFRDMVRLSGERQHASQLPQEAFIPAALGASPLGKAPDGVEHQAQMTMMDCALGRMPLQMDSEKPRSYLPKLPWQTTDFYPQQTPQNADSLEYYLRLSPETLFFVFYYMEGSRAQLLAAKALKKLSWRFHTKYLMWFQRHEEPKQITDDYEQGTYIYFDYEKWAQRKKELFTFEYRYLEDKDFD